MALLCIRYQFKEAVMRERTKKELDDLSKKLISAIYYEFCYRQRDQSKWEAGFNTMQQL